MARIRIDIGPEGFFGQEEQGQRSVFVFLWAPIQSQPSWEFMDDGALQNVPIAGREWLIGRY